MVDKEVNLNWHFKMTAKIALSSVCAEVYSCIHKKFPTGF